MSIGEKLEMLESLTGLAFTSAQETMFESYLKLAEQEILHWRYSYTGNVPSSLPEEYDTVQIFAVIAGYTQQGAEGQSNHSENGISATFKYGDMVEYIHRNVIPYVKVI